jgi:hypothetical protein
MTNGTESEKKLKIAERITERVAKNRSSVQTGKNGCLPFLHGIDGSRASDRGARDASRKHQEGMPGGDYFLTLTGSKRESERFFRKETGGTGVHGDDIINTFKIIITSNAIASAEGITFALIITKEPSPGRAMNA